MDPRAGASQTNDGTMKKKTTTTGGGSAEGKRTAKPSAQGKPSPRKETPASKPKPRPPGSLAGGPGIRDTKGSTKLV